MRAIHLSGISILASAGVLAASLGAPAAAKEAELRFVSNWGKNLYSVKRTIEWSEEFNKSAAAKAAKISIKYIGGREVTPPLQQLTALRKGVFDMLFGAAGYYLGAVPESFAIYGSKITPMEARKNGGLALLNRIYRKKANAHVLGWVAGGVGVNLWLKKKPKVKADGTPDLSGMKIRGIAGLHREWLKAMGATQISVPAPGIYNALERNLVDGAAWLGLGIMGFGFQKFVNFRVDPMVWQFDNLIWINLDKWNSLTQAQRDALTTSVIAYEPIAHVFYEKLVAERWAKLGEQGVKSFELTGAAARRYIAAAEKVQWDQVKKLAPNEYDELRKKFPPSPVN